MKITLTLDDDLATQLEERAEALNISFEQVVNDTLRRGLDLEEPPKKRPAEFRTFPGGFRPEFKDVSPNKLNADLEMEEMLRKLHR